MKNAKKNLVFHFGVGRHVSFPQTPVAKTAMLLQNYFHLIVLAFRKTTWKLEGSKEMKAQPPLHMYENGENKADVRTRVVESDCNKNI